MSLSFHAAQTPHFFTVDVEDYFQDRAFERLIPRSSWDAQPSRVEENVDALLQMLADAQASGTFFTLGWTAERFPEMVRRIARAGHEVASHGFAHRRVDELSPGEFREEVRRSRMVLEDVSGAVVHGFRAPGFSILSGSEWAYEILLEEGYEYDSSRFPVRRAGYGSPDTPRYAHAVRCCAGTLVELPLTTLDAFGTRLPAAGGASLRHLPYGVVRSAFRARQRDGVPGVFYLHPWEIDPEQPRVKASLITCARHYGGLRHTRSRVERLLREFRFTAIADSLPELRRVAPLVHAA
jgi:polysaccharide deacetylase family protein (PEP-CTERM system associated)